MTAFPILKLFTYFGYGFFLGRVFIFVSNCFGGGGGGFFLWGKGFWKAGSSCEMWKTGWTTQNCCGRQIVMECIPRVPIILKGPRFFSASFLEGRVVWKNFAFTYVQSLTLKAGGGICWQSAALW